MIDKCSICGETKEIYVGASDTSLMGEFYVTFGYCEDCLQEGSKLYDNMILYIACQRVSSHAVIEMSQDSINHILNSLKIPYDKFIKDVDKSTHEVLEEYYKAIMGDES
jgi:hypothetical protein